MIEKIISEMDVGSEGSEAESDVDDGIETSPKKKRKEAKKKQQTKKKKKATGPTKKELKAARAAAGPWGPTYYVSAALQVSP